MTKKDNAERRRIVIETDGVNINIAELDSTPLELCEICRRIIKKFKGDL